MKILATALMSLMVASTCLADDAPLPVYRPPLRIEIRAGATPETAQAKQTIAIDGRIAEIFQDQPVIFDPTENLDDATLVCESTGETLAVGTTDKSPVYVERTFPKLLKDQPAEIRVRVADPQSIRPGVYRGTLWTLMRNDGEVMNRSLKVHWEIILVVHGRRLIEAQFDEVAAGRPLRVGAPASLLITVDTIGCDLGEGFVKLDWSPVDERAQRALYTTVPLPHAVDPLVAFAESSAEQGCHSQWRDSPIWTEVDMIGQGDSERDVPYQRYQVRVAAPDCFLPGTMNAEVSWAQASTAANRTPLSQRVPAQPIQPGILVFPKPAFVNEPMTALVRTTDDLGTVVALTLSGPDGQPTRVDLARRRQLAADRETLYEYVGGFRPAVMGSHQLTWVGDEQTPAKYPLAPVRFDVCFGAETTVLGEIEVFASAPPFWMMDATGWNVTRQRAYRFWYDPRLLREAELVNLATFRGQLRDALQPHDPDLEPVIQIRPSALAASDANGADPAKLSGREKAADDAAEGGWSMTLGNLEQTPRLDLTVDLIRDEAGHPRHRIASYDFVQRMLIHGRDSRGRPVERIVNIPLAVRVSTEWQYYRRLAAGLGVFFGVVLLGMIFWRRAVGPSPRRTVASVRTSEVDPFEDASEGFFSKSPPDRPQHAWPDESAPEGDPDPGADMADPPKDQASELPSSPADTSDDADWWK